MTVLTYNGNRSEEGTMANQIGKRYICTNCGSKFIVTRGGEGTIQCCGKPMELEKAEKKQK
jgi:ribosomal protein L37AE/L43A